jgi:hypothetical protein
MRPCLFPRLQELTQLETPAVPNKTKAVLVLKGAGDGSEEHAVHIGGQALA